MRTSAVPTGRVAWRVSGHAHRVGTALGLEPFEPRLKMVELALVLRRPHLAPRRTRGRRGRRVGRRGRRRRGGGRAGGGSARRAEELIKREPAATSLPRRCEGKCWDCGGRGGPRRRACSGGDPRERA